MKVIFGPRFIKAYSKLPKPIKNLFDDKHFQFLDNWRHLSFRIHKLGGTNVYSASLNMNIRFAFSFEQDAEGNVFCLLRNIGGHEHTMRPPY